MSARARNGKAMKPVLPEDLVARLLDCIEVAPLAPAREGALRARLMARIAAGKAGIRSVRAGEGPWTPLVPGVEAKVLHDDAAGRTWLARLSPGATVPAHVHEGDEEILILEGSCMLGEEMMNVGDFERAPRGSAHPAMFSAGGCLLLVRWAAAPTAPP